MSGAILALLTQFSLPKEFHLDSGCADHQIGGMLIKVFANNTVEVRFLRLLKQKELDKIFVCRTHPAHRDRVPDIRA